MKIVVLCRTSVFHRFGGMPEAVWQSAKVLAAAGHEVHYITAAWRFANAHIDGVHLHFLPNTNPSRYAEFFAAARSKYDEISEKERVNVVLAHSKSAKAFLLGKRVAAKVFFVTHGIGIDVSQNEPNVAMAHNKKATLVCKLSHVDTDWHMTEQRMLASHDGVFAISSCCYADLKYRMQLSNVSLVRNPCVYSVENADSCTLPTAVVSSQNAIKGVDLLLRGINGAFPIRIVGPVKLDSKQYPWVHTTGAVPAANVPAMIANSSLLIDPAIHYSGSNMTLAMALCLRVPVLGFQTPGMHDAVAFGGGEEVPFTHPELLVPAAQRILRKRDSYANAAFTTWQSCYSANAYLRDFADACKKVGAV